MSNSVQKVIIHCKESLRDWLFTSGLEFECSDDNEIDVIVDDVEYRDGNHPDQNNIWEDPDIQLCNHYGIDYDQVNCIELM